MTQLVVAWLVGLAEDFRRTWRTLLDDVLVSLGLNLHAGH